ncbi:MAG: hypothetical protein R2797_11050 [Gelidibacter sp.]
MPPPCDTEDAESGENAIADRRCTNRTPTAAQTIYVRVTNDATGCYTVVDLTFR